MTIMQMFLWFVIVFGNAVSAYIFAISDSVWADIFLLATIGYSIIGLHDVYFSRHNLNRLYPVVAYIRYFLESFRVEIQQYFIANDTEELPFNREQRSLVYQRAKGISDTIAFGTQRDLMQSNYLSIWHSMSPTSVLDSAKHVVIGGSNCTKPYQSSYLNISAMSFGALSSNAITALNLGAAKGGFSHNTGEGGISPYHLQHGGDLVWQIGTGLFGCRDESGRFNAEMFKEQVSHKAIKMIEIKLSQGAKPGHGGVLPKEKITEEIASIRKVSREHDCISPAINPECTTPKDLLNFIQRLRELSGGKPIGIKLCIGNPAEFLGLCKAMLSTKVLPDFITVDGAEGGTGAAPVEFSNRLGMMCNEATYLVHNALTGIGLRDEIKIIAAGKTASSFEVLSKVAFGADIVNCARTMMMALGCVQSKHCNNNKCPTGIATQDPARAKAIDVELKSERVKNFQHHTLESFFELVGSMGLDNPNKLTPAMLKRRTSNGLFITCGSLIKPLKAGQLLESGNETLSLWSQWWLQANEEQFYVEDDVFVLPVEMMGSEPK